MRCLVGMMLLLGVAGCHKPFWIVGDSRVALEPLAINGRLAIDFPPRDNRACVQPMPLGCCPIQPGCPRIAVVDVDGILLNADFTGPYSLGENPVVLFREKLDAIAADADVCSVILRINSPGGSVTATDIMRHDLAAFRARTGRPVIVCLLDLGAGGAYHLATAADVIVAHPTSITGGIGVIINLYNLRETMAQLNILGQSVKAGTNIDMGSPTHALTAQARGLLQAMADEFHLRFRRMVEEARPGLDRTDETLFDGRVFTARQALENRLIDRVGYLDDALALAREKAGLAEAQPVLYHRPNDPAHTSLSVTPNTPMHTSIIPASLPGLDRSRLPLFLCMWQPEVTMDKLSGR